VAKKKQPPRSTPATLSPTEWMPFGEAFARIRASIGSSELACDDLLAALRDGSLRAAVRGRSFDRRSTLVDMLDRAAWAHVRLASVRREDGSEGVRILLPSETYWDAVYWFFVNRADLEKRYPAVIVPLTPNLPAEQQAEADEPQRIKPGRKTRHPWKRAVLLEVARRAVKGERMLAGSEALEFCVRKFDWEPDARQMQRLLRALRDMLDN
jgi:hypothetical protein